MHKELVSEFHLIEKDYNERELYPGSGFYVCGDWAVAHDTAECMVGAEIYLRASKNKPSRLGGIIQSFEVVDPSDIKSRVRFKFVASKDLDGVTTNSENWAQMRKDVWESMVSRKPLEQLTFQVTDTDMDSDLWLVRQKNTSKLIRAISAHLFSKAAVVTPEQLYGLCRLTWITSSEDSESTSYLKSVKIPGLGNVMQTDYSGLTLQDVANQIANSRNDNGLKPLIVQHTGFTNLYGAYRTSLLSWIKDNFTEILVLFKHAFQIRSNLDRIEICKRLDTLPGIPTGGGTAYMPAKNALTPVLFSLDPVLRFPIINGRPGVKNLLKGLNVSEKPLSEQYKAIAQLLDSDKFANAADLDRQVSEFVNMGFNEWLELLTLNRENQTSTDNSKTRALQKKNEDEVTHTIYSRTQIYRKVHNRLTNKLKSLFPGRVKEGGSRDCMFDVSIDNYDHQNNKLYVEVKSTSDLTTARMAIGQILDYWCQLHSTLEPRHIAILLNGKPSKRVIDLLDILEIGLLWFEGEKMLTTSNKLKLIAEIGQQDTAH